MGLKTWNQVLWIFQSSTPSRQISLQVGTLSKIENFQYFLYVIARVKYQKEGANEWEQKAFSKAKIWNL